MLCQWAIPHAAQRYLCELRRRESWGIQKRSDVTLSTMVTLSHNNVLTTYNRCVTMSRMAYMHLVKRDAWECEACQWRWFQRTDKLPKQCPNHKCRQRLKLREDQNGSRETEAVIASSEVSAVRSGVRDNPSHKGKRRDTRPGSVLGSF